MTECPKCFLPTEDGAWQCDGCGHVGLAIIGGLVYLATLGYIYISVGLMLAVVGSIGHAIHKLSVLRGHLRLLDRRHVPLPAARLLPGSGDPDQEK